jgi:tetratricopeptide (TPR) repeat protein
MDEWMLGWLTRAADALVEQAPGVAAELLTRATAGSPAGTARHCWLASRLADAHYRMGDTAEAEQVASLALEYATEPDVVEDLHWTLAQCRMVEGSAAEPLAALDRALAAPGISARHRARLLVLAARTRLHLGEVEETARVASSALEAATEAADNWAMAWALHVLTIMTGVQGRMADTLPLFNRALAVTQAEPGLTDLRLLLQINQAVALAGLDRYGEALTAARRARQLASQVGTARRRMQAHSALGQLLFETGRWDEALAEVAALDEDLKEPGAACCDLGIAAVICFHRGETGEARRHLAVAVPYAGRIGRLLIGRLRWPAAWTANLTAPCRRRWPCWPACSVATSRNSRSSKIYWPTPSAWPCALASWPPRGLSSAGPPPSPPGRRSRIGRRTICTAAPCWTTTPLG